MGTLCFINIYWNLVNITFVRWVKEHFVVEQITFEQNALSPENGKREAWSAEMHVCVGWYVKWKSLWRYTTLPSYNFIEWMISMIVTVHLWCQSKYCTNQTGSIDILRNKLLTCYIVHSVAATFVWEHKWQHLPLNLLIMCQLLHSVSHIWTLGITLTVWFFHRYL